MSALKKVALVIAAIAVVYFAPVLAPHIGSFLGLGTGFIGTAIGSLVLATGVTILQTVFSNRGHASSIEAGKVNVRIAEPPRWLCAGVARQGGGVLFAEFDASGNLWYLVVHSDSILTNAVQYYLDDVPVTLDASGNVLTKDFRLKDNKKKDPATTDGEGIAYVQIWTTTYSESNPTPPAVAALASAFPGKWTADHKLVGTTYSVVRMAALKIEDRYKMYRWRGAIGLGEPAVGIVGEWSNVYDPRDVEQTVNDATTHSFSKNPVLIWAWFRTHRYGRNKARSSINWDRVAEQAAICDQTVTGIAGTHVRYQCGIAIPDNKERSIAEQEILLTMDAQIVFDNDGKSWPRVGAYYSPTLTLTRNRDIVAMESVEAQDGESETQGVIVRYTDPAANYTAQPSAAWYNPLYYVEGQSNTFLTVDILACQDHNQAMRLAKGIGQRSQPLHKIMPTVGLRGLKARQERILLLNYDNTFAGDYEIATPVEVDPVGIFCGFGLVPVDENRWSLLPGEEKAKPVVSEGDGGTVLTVDPPAGVTVTHANGRIEATFSAPSRADVRFEFQYILTADIATDNWSEMTVEMENLFAFSGGVTEGQEYSVRWRAVTSAGQASDWNTPATVAVGLSITPATNLTLTPAGAGNVTVSWRNPNSNNFDHVKIFRANSNNFAVATDISGALPGGLGQVQEHTDTVTEGHYYYWVVAYATDATAAPETGPADIIVIGTGTNLIASPNDFTTWTGDNSGSPATNPVVTADYGAAPDGTTTADRLQFNRSTGSLSRLNLYVSVTNATNYKFGVWLKAPASGYSVAIWLDSNVGPALILTNDWQYYTFNATSVSTSMRCQLLIYSGIANSPANADVQAWGARLALA